MLDAVPPQTRHHQQPGTNDGPILLGSQASTPPPTSINAVMPQSSVPSTSPSQHSSTSSSSSSSNSTNSINESLNSRQEDRHKRPLQQHRNNKQAIPIVQEEKITTSIRDNCKKVASSPQRQSSCDQTPRVEPRSSTNSPSSRIKLDEHIPVQQEDRHLKNVSDAGAPQGISSATHQHHHRLINQRNGRACDSHQNSDRFTYSSHQHASKNHSHSHNTGNSNTGPNRANSYAARSSNHRGHSNISNQKSHHNYQHHHQHHHSSAGNTRQQNVLQALFSIPHMSSSATSSLPSSEPVMSDSSIVNHQRNPLGPPHYVDLHVNAGECVSLQLLDGQEQVVAGPTTITMVSQQHNPPVPIPVQVPPGHMIHQIADENGTLRHIILSVMDNDYGSKIDSSVFQLSDGNFQIGPHGELVNVDEIEQRSSNGVPKVGGSFDEPAAVAESANGSLRDYANQTGCSSASETRKHRSSNSGRSQPDNQSTNSRCTNETATRTDGQHDYNDALSSSHGQQSSAVAVDGQELDSAIVSPSNDLVDGQMIPLDQQLYGYPSCCCCCYCDPQGTSNVTHDQMANSGMMGQQELVMLAPVQSQDQHPHQLGTMLGSVSVNVDSSQNSSNVMSPSGPRFPMMVHPMSMEGVGLMSEARQTMQSQQGQNGLTSAAQDKGNVSHKLHSMKNSRGSSYRHHKSYNGALAGHSYQNYNPHSQHQTGDCGTNYKAPQVGHTDRMLNSIADSNLSSNAYPASHGHKCQPQAAMSQSIQRSNSNPKRQQVSHEKGSAVRYPGNRVSNSISSPSFGPSSQQRSSNVALGDPVSPMRSEGIKNVNHQLTRIGQNATNPNALDGTLGKDGTNHNPPKVLANKHNPCNNASMQHTSSYSSSRCTSWSAYQNRNGKIDGNANSNSSEVSSSVTAEHNAANLQIGRNGAAKDITPSRLSVKSSDSPRGSPLPNVRNSRGKQKKQQKDVGKQIKEAALPRQDQLVSRDAARPDNDERPKSLNEVTRESLPTLKSTNGGTFLKLAQQDVRQHSASNNNLDKLKINDRQSKKHESTGSTGSSPTLDLKSSKERQNIEVQDFTELVHRSSKLADSKSGVSSKSPSVLKSESPIRAADKDISCEISTSGTSPQTVLESLQDNNKETKRTSVGEDQVKSVVEDFGAQEDDRHVGTTLRARDKPISKGPIRTSSSENNLQSLKNMSSMRATVSKQANVSKHQPMSRTSSVEQQEATQMRQSSEESRCSAMKATAESIRKKLSDSKKKSALAKLEHSTRSNALAQIRLLNLNCVSVSSNSVCLRWTYIPAVAEKFDIYYNQGTKNQAIFDHFVVELASSKSSDGSNLIASKTVYQGCALTCRVNSLSPEKVYHFRVRRTRLLSTPGDSSEQLGVSEILSVTLPSAQQSNNKNKHSSSKAMGGVIQQSNDGQYITTASATASSSHSTSNNAKSSQHQVRLSTFLRQYRSKLVSSAGQIVHNSLSSYSDARFAGVLLALFTVFSLLLAIFIHNYVVAPVSE